MIIYKFIKNLIIYVKHRRVIDKIIKEENLISNLSQLFGTAIKKDWIGRLYTVINPLVHSRDNAEILEYTENGVTNKSFVEKWIMDRLVAADMFMQNHNLFDILTYDIEQLDEYNNFLFVITPVAWFEFKKWLGWFFTELLALITIGTSLLVYFTM